MLQGGTIRVFDDTISLVNSSLEVTTASLAHRSVRLSSSLNAAWKI